MKFIELTSGSNEKTLINLEKVFAVFEFDDGESEGVILKWSEIDNPDNELGLDELYFGITYEEIKQILLNV